MNINPFVFEKFATGMHFCGRERETKLLVDRCHNCTNSLVFGKRRYGKSSLIHQVFSQLADKDFLKVYVDLFDLVNANDFSRLLYSASTEAIPLNVKDLIGSLGNYFKKTTFDVSVGTTGMPKITPALASRNFEEFVFDALDGLSRYANDHKMKVVIALDEFQQIATIKEKKIDAILRKYLQSNKTICIIFSGSKRHMLSSLFHQQNCPLYKMASGLEIKGINPEDFYQHVQKKMNAKLSKESFRQIYTLADGESKLTQQLCHHLYQMNKDTITEEDINTSLNKILDEDNGIYRMILSRLTNNQRLALRQVVKHSGRELFTADNLKNAELTKQSLYSSLTSLNNSEVVDREDDVYFIPDRGFELWLTRNLY